MSEKENPTAVVVNDDPSQLRLACAILEKDGVNVLPCANADEALALLQERGTPDILITDLNMPGIDGWRLCKLLRSAEYAAFNRVPILVVSATFSGVDAEQITSNLGADAFLGAPYHPFVLRSYVRSLLAGETPRQVPKVLIVEDSPTQAKLLRRAFEAGGYRVFVAHDGQNARRLYRRHYPEIAILDYYLPDVTGDQLLAPFKQPESPTVCIMITTDTSPELSTRLMRMGADAYVRKPFDPEYLIDLCQKACRERSLLRVEKLLEARTRQLRESEERFRRLFQSIPETVIVHSLDGLILHINEFGCRRLEADAEDLAGRRLAEVVAPHCAPDLEAHTRTALAQGVCFFEIIYVSRKGRAFEAEVNQQPIEHDGQRAILCVARDVTERKQAERDRRQFEAKVLQAQKLESLGLLAGGIAHDFNNLLMGVLGNAGLALMDLPPDSPLRARIQQIDTAARRAAELTSQMLAYSGKGRLIMEPVNLSGVVEEMTGLLRASIPKKVELRCELDAELPAVTADPTQVRQVVMNLITNASEAIGSEGGRILLRTGLVSGRATRLSHPIHYGELGDGPYVLLEICDTGCGMDSETLPKIFDPFYSTKFTGRGLGLAAVLGIVRGHRGAIDVRSQPGRGTTFKVFFPSSGAPAPKSRKEEPAADLLDGSGTVLLIDDEEAVRDVARLMLEKFGFNVITAPDGREGLRLFKERCSEIVAVLLDLSMPHMGGDEVFQEIRRLRPHTPVILSSGYSETEVTTRFDGQGLAGFLQKPYQPRTLVTMIRQALHV